MSIDMDSGASQLPYAYAKTDPDKLRRAQLAVAHHALDKDDCAELLEMLKLLPWQQREER